MKRMVLKAVLPSVPKHLNHVAVQYRARTSDGGGGSEGSSSKIASIIPLIRKQW